MKGAGHWPAPFIFHQQAGELFPVVIVDNLKAVIGRDESPMRQFCTSSGRTNGLNLILS
jgi:hypothetical protein